MRYFERVGLTVFTDSTGAAVISAPPWCLLTRVRQHLEIVQVVNPTGQDFFNHRGKAAEDRIIFLSSREPIPSDEKIPWRSIESLAFTMPCRAGSEESGNDGVDDTPKPKRKTKKAKGNKRLSSIAFDDSDEGEDSGSQIESIAKRRSTRRHVSDIDSALLPSIFTDSLAQEIGGSDNAVAGPSSHNTNAVAGPSRLSDPIDLTRSPSPEMPSFKWRQVTPESQFIGALDAPDSDPVDYYTYTSGPRPLRKFF
ncbi:hypothetical protein C8R47DRAFT_1118437 [Mycena vitilis]|nr:hypothetical protein C8R47DRAFT_1118428 [Mycena vitilis]KAJ6494120.1 hypothetical protein C8R47DRAFT_1118437 [Mycena vitilis]